MGSLICFEKLSDVKQVVEQGVEMCYFVDWNRYKAIVPFIIR